VKIKNKTEKKGNNQMKVAVLGLGLGLMGSAVAEAI
jgi:hypothetical protein